MEPHQVKQIQYEATQLLNLKETVKSFLRNEAIKLYGFGPNDMGVVLEYKKDNACYRAVAAALETYANELSHRLSRAVEEPK